ncbi:MAG TPA: hypothetical protein VF510_05965 [Ktedonobacterales bacterium]
MDDQIPSPKESPRDAEAFDTPFTEYCVWQGDRFVPATPEEAELIRERERVRTALWHLQEWERLERPRAMRWLPDWVHTLFSLRSSSRGPRLI